MTLTLKPIDVYAAYPEADLVPLPKPEPTDTFEYYISVAGHNDIRYCGDTLYAFILFEMCNAISDEDALQRIQTAIRDLQAIENKIQEIVNVRSQQHS